MWNASSIALSNFPPHLKIVVNTKNVTNSYRFENAVCIRSNARSIGPEVGIGGDELPRDVSAGSGGRGGEEGGGKFHLENQVSFMFARSLSMNKNCKTVIFISIISGSRE